MPILKCQKEGKSGFKFGESGKCFTGPGAREKARKQGAAIKSRAQIILEELAKVLTQKKRPPTTI